MKKIIQIKGTDMSCDRDYENSKEKKTKGKTMIQKQYR